MEPNRTSSFPADEDNEREDPRHRRIALTLLAGSSFTLAAAVLMAADLAVVGITVGLMAVAAFTSVWIQTHQLRKDLNAEVDAKVDAFVKEWEERNHNHPPHGT